MDLNSEEEIHVAYMSFSLNDNVYDIEYVPDVRDLGTSSDSENDEDKEVEIQEAYFNTEHLSMQVIFN